LFAYKNRDIFPPTGHFFFWISQGANFKLLIYHRQELVFLDNEIVFNEAIIEERDQGIQEIQHQITEVNEIFKDLAVLVHDQGAMIGMWPSLQIGYTFQHVQA
jgi:hypothetical protein